MARSPNRILPMARSHAFVFVVVMSLALKQRQLGLDLPSGVPEKKCRLGASLGGASSLNGGPHDYAINFFNGAGDARNRIFYLVGAFDFHCGVLQLVGRCGVPRRVAGV
jgi:hypothetical protein